MPEWADLEAQLSWARERGIACHLDGARLWEAAPYYGKSHAQIASLFDSVYVSFYKGLGGIAGAVLAGSEEFVERSRPWLRRHGGNLISLYPYVLSAKAGLARYRDAFGAYGERARALAAELSAVAGIRVVPEVPQSSMMHLHVARPAEALNRANQALASAHKVMLFGRARALDDATSLVELSIGSASASIPDSEAVELFASLLRETQP